MHPIWTYILNRPVGNTIIIQFYKVKLRSMYEVLKYVWSFMKFAFYSVINILTHKKPDSYTALASSQVWVGWYY